MKMLLARSAEGKTSFQLHHHLDGGGVTVSVILFSNGNTLIVFVTECQNALTYKLFNQKFFFSNC